MFGKPRPDAARPGGAPLMSNQPPPPCQVTEGCFSADDFSPAFLQMARIQLVTGGWAICWTNLDVDVVSFTGSAENGPETAAATRAGRTRSVRRV